MKTDELANGHAPDMFLHLQTTAGYVQRRFGGLKFAKGTQDLRGPQIP